MKENKIEQYVPTKPTGCFLDYTYCASENCQNKCGRKMTKEIKEAIQEMEFCRVSYAYFCGEEE